MNSTINTQPFSTQFDSNFRTISFALLISLIMHLSILRALPWLEAVKTPLPLNIIAELQTLAPPPPPPPAESKPIESPTKPEVVKTIQQPKPQAVATPVLAAEHTEQVSNYTVPDIPKPAMIPSEPTAPVAPEHTATASESAPASSKNVSASSSSSNTWEDSDVWDEYGNSLQKLCERYKQYPAIAIRRGYQGSGKVLVRFSAEGKATSISMEKSTGQKSLDDQAIEMVKKSLNELPVPVKFRGREFRVSIPVDFKLE